jgi:hypothetical protein
MPSVYSSRLSTNRHRTAARGSLGVVERNAVHGQIVALMVADANPVRNPQGAFFQKYGTVLVHLSANRHTPSPYLVAGAKVSVSKLMP